MGVSKHNYAPGQLLDLKSTLGPVVLSKTPNLRSIEETMRLAKTDINEPGSLQRILLELFTVQQLEKWVFNYESIYNRVVKPN